RFCDTATPGSKTCKGIVPEFFYSPANDASAGSVVVNPPQCTWNNPRFKEPSDHFGVVGLPASAVTTGSVSEDKVRQVLEKTTQPCVPAKLGEEFIVLGTGLTEKASDEALWRQISVSYDVQDSTHPPFSSVYRNTTVSTKSHDLATCS